MMSSVADDAPHALRYVIIGAAATIALSYIQALRQLPQTRIADMADGNAERGAARVKRRVCRWSWRMRSSALISRAAP